MPKHDFQDSLTGTIVFKLLLFLLILISPILKTDLSSEYTLFPFDLLRLICGVVEGGLIIPLLTNCFILNIIA